MLVAVDEDGKRTVGNLADKGRAYFCPGCSEPVVLKRGPLVIGHYAHRPNSSCPLAIGESARHLAMKSAVARLIGGQHDFEVPLLATRRADVVIDGRFIVECQASALSVDEWTERTKDYNQIGYPVLWVWDLARFMPDAKGRKLHELEGFFDDEYRVPAEIRWCHGRAYGRLYVLTNGPATALMACHLWPVQERVSEGGPTWPDSSYTPKTLRHVSLAYTRKRPVPMWGSGGELLVDLGDGVWWTN